MTVGSDPGGGGLVKSGTELVTVEGGLVESETESGIVAGVFVESGSESGKVAGGLMSAESRTLSGEAGVGLGSGCLVSEVFTLAGSAFGLSPSLTPLECTFVCFSLLVVSEGGMTAFCS